MSHEIEVNQKIGEKITKIKLEKVVAEALKIIGRKSGKISVAIVGDNEIKKLNKKYRDKDKVTDVLSFGYSASPLLGEIVICLPQVKRQAKENNIDWENELIFMLIHGVLHLCGYDHEKSEKEAREMEGLQKKIYEKIIK
ncbi:rRNA maturation RNase YbeY [Candidatus Falkowbacteria bacterium RIFOXYB2_FULL_38_15]|uniref:Endoribonuclease YbeY n=1 Tax=Candidatus Falkowbacteria bacterium RIFOXYA2_FULL_38_12 TaxID=1797993 RepID=A0A1F5S274_9BACT|nr:MAG: rRNA maturation RNase YbeY [Candidatus Falkowbacteria bacterium RIFOXYA2_FULL_38_12]OGF32655.1 MAG: rRNA maturation RNase YbeY [Candidatus Falkowbacteria bacterium RIFOXYB2_FULL_38_15]OGF42059.1 MAG: rRNA maturation RNase YbeY [Candidatus Falkowbacteria bacterium RIFOXYD2_FULL_39_16]